TRAALQAAGDPPGREQDHPSLERDPASRRRDPGYHLIAGGRRAFEVRVQFRPPLWSWPSRFTATIGISGYVGGVTMVAAIILSLPLCVLAEAGIGGGWLGLLALLGLIPAIDAA